MPLSPTDPRVLADSELPMPPTTSIGGPAPGAGMAEARPRYVPVSSGESGGPRVAGERPFGNYHVPPTTSPYFLVYNNTAASGRNPNAPVESAGNAAANTGYDKPFDHYNPPPATSPYLLLNSNTANGTISTYNAYVRPALAQEANHYGEEAQSGQGTPSYPSVFLTQGQYNPNPTAGR
jgi:hypothetical protein